MKQLLTGNEAIARGAWEAGVRFASAYPGTPSTEILETLTTYGDIHSEWAPNEKVAMEAAIGASFAGARSIAAMKHVGVNVAADPLFTFAYTGVNGGMVLITADEPGQHSSQNEQDNRYFAMMAKIPMMEPADSQECLDMVKLGFAISEQFDTPVIIRMTTRVCHSKSIVQCGERSDAPIREYTKNAQKNVMVPAFAKIKRVEIEERINRLAEYSEDSALNYVDNPGTQVGIIASGVCYRYAKEVFGDNATYLKLGFTNPLPEKILSAFCQSVDKLYIIEETEPYIEQTVRGLGFSPIGKELLPAFGELTPDVLRRYLLDEQLPAPSTQPERVVPRPPTLCAGCPHRGFFYEIGKRKNVVVSGDIGCYTLGFAAPYNAMDWTICMGSSLSIGHGAQTVFDMKEKKDTRVVSVLGDSTFFHTGIASLMEVAYNGSRTVNVILDNRITGMTGHQQNPGSGYTAGGEEANIVDIQAMVRACGIKQVRTINPNNLKEVKETFDWALALDEPSVIITRWPCVLKRFTDDEKQEFSNPFTAKYKVDTDKCIGCKQCLRSGCPAIWIEPGQSKASITQQCVGCSVCAQMCPVRAIDKEEK